MYLERQNPGSRIVFGLELEAELSRTQARLEELERRFDQHLAAEKLNALPVRPASPPLSSTNHAPVALEDRNPVPHRRQSEYGHNRPASQSQGTPPISSTYSTFRPRSESDAHPPPERNGELHQGYALPNPTIEEPPSLTNGLRGSYPVPLSPALDNNDLPPQDMLYALTDLYFKHCNTWCPVLDRKTVFKTLSNRPHISEEDRVLLHAIVSAALRFFHDPRLAPEARERQYALSKRTVQMYAMENVSVGATRARVILCLDIVGASNGPAGGMVLAQLSQAVRQLGLCDETSVFLTSAAEDTATRSGLVRKLSTGQPGSWLEDEGRRRLCWMVYILDRYAAMAAVTTGYTLADSDVRRVLPCSYDLFSGDIPVETNWFGSAGDIEGGSRLSVVNKSQNLGSFSYHCEMITILSRVHAFATTPMDISSPSETAAWRNKYRQLDGTLDGWLQSLPGEYSRTSSLCHSDPASRVANWFLLHSAYVVAVVRLHASAAYPMLQSPLFVPSDYAIQRCVSAVQSLGGIVQDVREANGLYLVGPLFAFSLWVAARVLLVNAAAMGCQVDPMVDLFIQTLDDMGRHWEVARCYSRILARVVERGRRGDGTWGAMRR